MEKAMQDACARGDVEAMRVCVAQGSSVHAVDEMGRTLLHLAVRLDQFAVARWLLDNGAEVNATMGRGWTPLHYAARHAALELVALLVERGADPNATMTHGMSALHVAAEKNRVAIVDFLIRRGADSKAAMPKGLTALHLAVREGSIDTVVYYIQNGADVNLQTTAGVTLLHEAASRGNVEIMEVLLRHGADVHALDKEKRSALHRTLGGSRKRLARVYPAAKLLCAHGARWDADIDKLVPPKRSNLENDEEVNEPAANAWVSGMRVCVLHWEQQAADDSHELVDVPYEVVQRGAESVTTYLANLRKTVDGQLILRRKVCVVGPSQWGKTSLVKSLTSLLPSLVHPDHRTIGIDLFAYSFTQITEKKGVRRHEITFWDFAGQDEYQVAHALFFSKRTLYLVCIDLEQYDQKLQQLDACVSLRDAEHEMERFLRANVFRWVRAITSRQADAEFTIVGTKADTIQDAKRIQFIWSDLRSRLDAWLRLLADEIQVELSQLTATSDALCDDLSHLQQLHLRLNQLIRKDMIVMTSADVVTIERVRGQVEEIITSSDNSFVMPSMYTRVLDAIRGRQTHAARLSHAQRISHSVVPFQALCRSLMQAIDGLEPEECRDILQTLHDVGDLLWYQHEASGVLKDIVIIDPTLVLDFVREVITHEYVSKTTMANVPAHVVEEGRLTHAFLRELPLWRDADEELVFAFKQLLQYFQLAYPADGVDMDWDSDLIVPTYWKISVGRRDMENTSDHKEQHHIPPVKASGVAATAKINDTHHQRWEFELSPEVSETIFEQFAVQSYSSLFKRSVRSSRIETCAHGQRVVLATLSGESNALRDVIRIDVDTADETAGWQYLRYYVMALETVLDGYPGLVVSRYIVEILDDLELQNRSTNDDSMAMKKTRIVRHRLSTTIAALEDALWMGKDESSVYAAMPWLRQDLGWYVQRGWREPGALQQLRTHELLQDTVNKVDVLKKLVTTHDTRRRYPALWTLEYESVSDVMKLRMLSDLSGDCFHDPIPIAVPSSFLAKHGHTIKTGLSILSNIGPELISLGVLQKVIKAAGAAVCEDVNRSTAVHRLVDSLNVSDGNPFVSETTRSLAPQGAVALLRDLLRLHDPSFDDLMISDLSKLQCAVTGDGHYIWAHRLEIMSLGDKLTPCDVDDLSTCSYSSSHASTVPTTSTTPAVTRASSTTQANASSGFTGTSVHKEEPHVYLRIMGVVGLTPWDWRKIYCSWEIAVDSPHATTASVSASTPPHTNYAVDPTWNALEFTVPGFTSIDALSHCVLRVRIKRPSRCLGIVKQVGHGLVKLDDVLPYEHVRGTVTYSVLVPLDEESPPSRYVTCELKAHC